MTTLPGTGEPAAHALARYRCFLPDLAGLAGLRRAGPGALDSNTFQCFPFWVEKIFPAGLKSGENRTVSSTPVAVRQRMGSAERFFQRSLYLLLVVGFTALAGTGKLDFLSLVLGGSALVLRGYHLLKKRRSYRIPERWTNYLTILYFLFYALDYFLLSQSFVSATVHMVLFIMVVKIFSVQRDRDLLYLQLLPFLIVLAPAVLTVH